MLVWKQDQQGEIVLQRQFRAHGSAVTAFDVSHSGKFLGTGTSEGGRLAADVLSHSPPRLCRTASSTLMREVALRDEHSKLWRTCWSKPPWLPVNI